MRTAIAFAAALSPLAAQELRVASPFEHLNACYDPVRQRVIAVGQGNYSAECIGQVWRRAPDAGARAGHLYVEPASGRVVRVTPRDPYFWPSTTFFYAARVGTAWQDFTVAAEPPKRIGAAMAFAPGLGGLIVFGGHGALGMMPIPLTDTWRFDGATWTQQFPSSSPPWRSGAAMTYDSSRQRVVMFGGDNFAATLDDTWEWDGVGWQQVVTPSTPPPRANARMVFDSARNRVVLLGGTSAGSPVQDLWEYDGATWQQMPPLPPMMSWLAYAGAMVFDEATGSTLVLGGYDASGARRSDVYAWDGANWSLQAVGGRLPPTVFTSSVAADPSGTGALWFGSDWSSTASLWRWDGSAWSLAASSGPAARTGGCFWTANGASFLFGGSPAFGPLLGDVWQWNGTSWTQLAPTTSPSPREHTAAAFDVAHNLTLLFGGRDPTPLADTWIFDGVNWFPIPTSTQPPARFSHAMAYDSLRARIVLFGGMNATSTQFLDDTWEWDGSTWSQVITASAPAWDAKLAYDPRLQRIAAWSRSLGGLWTFDGTNWNPRPVVGDLASGAPLDRDVYGAVSAPDFTLLGVFGAAELILQPARAVGYGSGCGAQPPQITAAALPRLGDAAFAVDVANMPTIAPGVGLGVIGADFASASIPFGPCTLLIAPAVTATILALGTRTASLPVPLPATASLLGVPVFFQAFAFDPAAALGFQLSAGLRVDLGN